MWKPRLVVRTSKGGGFSSPTSSAGYALFGILGAAGSAACIAAALSGRPLMLFGLAVTGFSLLDASAWFLASPDERAAFVAEVRRQGGGERKLRARGPWPLVVVTTLLAASITMMLLGHPVFVAGVLVTAGIGVVLLIDLVRHDRGG